MQTGISDTAFVSLCITLTDIQRKHQVTDFQERDYLTSTTLNTLRGGKGGGRGGGGGDG